LAPNNPWSIAVKKNLTATHAKIGNSTALQSQGIASLCVNQLGNLNWNFKEKPKIESGPDSISALVNESHSVSIRVLNPVGGETFRWTRNGVPDAQNFGSDFFIPPVTLADDGDVFVCTVTNSEGATVSKPTVLLVRFPAPRPTVDYREFSDSLAVGFESPVGNSVIWASRNGEPYAKWPAGSTVLIRSDTRWKVYSVLGSDKSDTATYQFYSTNRPKAATPILKPPGGDFSGSIAVEMDVAKPAAIAYRMDTLSPASDSLVYREPLVLKKTTVITAIGVADSMRTSLPVRALFLDTSVKGDLRAPLAKPSLGIVDSNTVVQLSADTGSLWYRFEPGLWTYAPTGKVILSGRTHFDAVAVQGSRQSPVQTFQYLNGLSAPTTNRPSQRFRDSLFIQWSTPSKDAVIYAAINRNPTEQDRYVDSMRIDNTCFVRAFAVRGTDSSQITEVQYKLDPEIPTSLPLPADMVEAGKVTLSSPTKKGSIYYTLDGTVPGPSNWIRYTGAISIDSTLELKAVTVTGTGIEQLSSPVYTAFYRIKARDEVLLKPGDTVSLSDDWNLALNPGGSKMVEAFKALPPAGLTGFDSLRATFQIRGSQKGDSLSIVLEDTLRNGNALWFLAPGARKPSRLPQGLTVSLSGDGHYFLAIDTMPPTLRFSGSSINSEKFTVATFTLDDNGAALDYQVWRTDRKDSVQSVRSAATEVVLKLTLKNPPNALQNLGVRICAVESQGTMRTCLPKSQELFLPLPQHTDGVVTPSVWSVGAFADTKWDLVGLPFDLDSGITLNHLRTWNRRKDLTFAFYKPSAPKGFEFLKQEDKLVQGRAYWVASAQPLSELEFGAGQMHMGSESAFQYTLVKGWNAISGKQLTAIPWPIQRKDEETYRRSRLKGLWAIHPETGAWEKQDTLAPWRGYYVLWQGELDTVIDLTARAASKEAGKKAANARSDWMVELSQAGSELQLGAFLGASDEVAVEDESALPEMRANRSLLVSLRGKHVLGSDHIALHPDRIHSWTIRWEKRSDAPFRINRATLPDGHGLIAYSKGRNIGIDLLQGRDASGPIAGMDVPMGFSDTLQVLAGPSDLLQREWEKWPSLPLHESIRWLGSGKLALDLAVNRHVTFEIVDAKGRIRYRHAMELAAGHKIWSLPHRESSSTLGPQWIRVILSGNETRRAQTFPWFGF
jgi:Chitobiase/beta-hexosaminidase C-terminal domain